MSDVLKERRAGERRCEKVREKLAAAYAEVERLREDLRMREAEVERLRGKLAADRSRRGMFSVEAWAEVERLRAAGQRCMEMAGIAGHMNILDVMGAALRGEVEK